MNSRRIYLLGLACIGSAALIAAGDSGDQPGPFGGRKVFVIGIDGCRPDALQAADTPNIDALIETGAVSWDSYAGGELRGPTEQITSSGPGWTSILTGVWRNKHRVADNSFAGYRSKDYPHFFQRIKEVQPNACLASLVSWGPIDDYIVAPAGDFTDFRFKGIGATYAIRDRSVTNRTVNYLAEADPDVVMVHLDQVDGAGHASGFAPNVRAYLQAIKNVDGMIGEMLDAIKARPHADQEDWLVIVTTDHGGLGTSHGGQSATERRIFMVASGGRATKRVVSPGPGHVAVPPTAMHHLGIPGQEAWGMEAGPFGVPPFCPANLEATGDPVALSVRLTWSPAAEIDIDSLQILRDGQAIATLPPGAESFLDRPPLPGNPGVRTFRYTLAAVGGSDSALCPPLVADAEVFNGPLETGLVLHLPFDGDAKNAVTGSEPESGELVEPGSLQFPLGPAGQYLEAGGGGHVTVGRSGPIQIASGDHATVSLLVRRTHPAITGATLLANKHTSERGQRGWGIEASPTGAWKWQASDGVDSETFTSPGTPLTDGGWHHLTVVLNRRDGEALFYTDGRESGRKAISQIGDLASASLPLAAAADGAGSDTFSGSLDEIMLWKRSLYPGEIAALAETYLKPAPLSRDPALVAEYQFEGNVEDSSGNALHGAASPGAGYEPGVSGKALRLANHQSADRQYMTLGTAEALAFGESSDFTVALWVRSDGEQSFDGAKSDPALITNKDWRSGSGTGWILAAAKNGAWQWNLGDGNATHRADYDSPPGALDGGWHHLAVSHDRDGSAILYQDGRQVATIPISEVGDISASGLPTVIATDGALGANWPAWFSGAVDEVRIWRRTLSPIEINMLHNSAQTMAAWRREHFNEAQQGDPGISGNGADPDRDGFCNLLEFALGTSPVERQGIPRLHAEVADGFFRMTFLRRPDSHGIRYTPQVSFEPGLTPGSWQSNAGAIEQVEAIPAGDGLEWVTVRSLAPVSEVPLQFMRLMVSPSG